MSLKSGRSYSSASITSILSFTNRVATIPNLLEPDEGSIPIDTLQFGITDNLKEKKKYFLYLLLTRGFNYALALPPIPGIPPIPALPPRALANVSPRLMIVIAVVSFYLYSVYPAKLFLRIPRLRINDRMYLG
jgi:hypothetical protein